MEQNTVQREEQLTAITPSKRQLAHQQLEFYGFFHYTINTYTGKEWGDGTSLPLFSLQAIWTPDSGFGPSKRLE